MTKAVGCDPVSEADQDQGARATQANQAADSSAGGHAVDKDRSLRRRRRRRKDPVSEPNHAAGLEIDSPASRASYSPSAAEAPRGSTRTNQFK